MIDYSIVIPTVGRKEEVFVLLDSIKRQMPTPKVVIIVDQNVEPLDLVDILDRRVNINHLHVDWKGAAQARNYGLTHVETQWVIFADDDSEFSDGFFNEIATSILNQTESDALAFMIKDKVSGECMLNSPADSCEVTKYNIHKTTCESTMLWKVQVLRRLSGYDESLGVGRYHGSEEGADIVLRALKANLRIQYFPSPIIFHPAQRDAEPDRFLRYARGTGRYYKKHFFEFAVQLFCMKFIIKNIIGVSLFIRDYKKRQKHLNRLKGFIQGFITS